MGQCLLADELALWGKTICRWDKPELIVPDSNQNQDGHNYDIFLFIFMVATLLSIAFVLFFLRLFMYLVNNKTVYRPAWRPATIIAFSLQLFACAIFVFFSAISWIQVLIFMAFVTLLEELTIRPSIVTEIFDKS